MRTRDERLARRRERDRQRHVVNIERENAVLKARLRIVTLERDRLLDAVQGGDFREIMDAARAVGASKSIATVMFR